MEDYTEIAKKLSESKKQFESQWNGERILLQKINQKVKSNPFAIKNLVYAFSSVAFVVLMFFVFERNENETENLVSAEQISAQFSIDDYIAMYDDTDFDYEQIDQSFEDEIIEGLF